MAMKSKISIEILDRDTTPTEAELAWAKAHNPSGVRDLQRKIDAAETRRTARLQQSQMTRVSNKAWCYGS